MKKLPVIYVRRKESKHLGLDRFPNAGPNPNITGMREKYGYGPYLVKSGAYLYNVDRATYEKLGGRP